MFLTIPNTIFISHRVKPKALGQEIEISENSGVVWFDYNDGAIRLGLAIDELRAIMRLFDVADNE